MSFKKGLVAAFVVAFSAMAGSPVWAQYWDRSGYDYYAAPTGGGAAYPSPYSGPRGYYAPPPSNGYAAEPYGYEAYGGNGAGRQPYSDPYNGQDDAAGGRYDLGPNGNRTTREEVPNPTRQPPGTIVIDTASRHLYLTEPDGQALQYGIGVGREGFSWKGVAKVARKAEWPGWTPPAAMLKRRPDLPLHMEGGIDNPLGARALYLFNGKGDTGFRIHGTNEPDTIGQAVSSGCIRMMNADVIDLYRRVPVGTRVVVL